MKSLRTLLGIWPLLVVGAMVVIFFDVSTVLVVGLLWLVGIPTALRLTLRGRWPWESDKFWTSPVWLWLAIMLWPLTLAIALAKLILQGLWEEFKADLSRSKG